jgi:hypothetical protein
MPVAQPDPTDPCWRALKLDMLARHVALREQAHFSERPISALTRPPCAGNSRWLCYARPPRRVTRDFCLA